MTQIMTQKKTWIGLIAGLSAAITPLASMAQAPAPNAAQAARAPGMNEGVVALVNDEIISSYDLRQRMLLLMITSGVQPTEETLPALQQQALRGLVDERLQMQEMKQFKLNVEDSEVDEEIENLARQNGITGVQLLETLKQAGVDSRTLREQIRAEVGWGQLINGRFRSRARVGQDTITATLERLAAEAQKPRYLIGEVFLDAAVVGGMDQARYGAQQLFQQLQQGAPFQGVARQFSNAPSAASGGDAGWVNEGSYPAKVEEALRNMRPGQLSMPIETDDGVYLVFLRERSEGGADTVFELKQLGLRLDADASAARVSEAQRTLSQLQSRVDSCDRADSLASGSINLDALGEVSLSELAEPFAAAIKDLPVGKASAPVRTRDGLQVLVVCGKKVAGGDAPDERQVAERLTGQRLSVLAKRYLRDLRSSATIEMK
ncbi:MAG: peptidylprolyl isomerase [Asticcacaulis sp.]